jgi:transcriptional regulator with XRE-family HTH domain
MPDQTESLGRRIAAHRTKLGMTQHELAERIAISRTALSHLELGTSTPSERTIVLLAGLFKLEPRELVAGTSYPVAKADRLPSVTARYTEVEMLIALLERDIAWLDRAGREHAPCMVDEWEARLRAVDEYELDLHERELLRDARRRVRALRA